MLSLLRDESNCSADGTSIVVPGQRFILVDKIIHITLIPH